MGNSSSSAPTSSTPPPQPPMPVITAPVQRSPVLDGASGLHYSGRLYTNEASQLAADICNGATASVDQIKDIYTDPTTGKATGVSSPDLPIDEATKRISTTALQGHVGQLVSQGLIPGQIGNFDAQMTADKGFYATVKSEYCFYEARYIAALTQFLALVSDPHGADPKTTQPMLAQTVALNRRLNSLLEIINYIGNERAQSVNQRSPQIDKANDDLQSKMALLEAQKNFLESGDSVTRTQEEMIRYSAEKSRAMNIQIMFFVAVNVVALATVFQVYTTVGK